MKLLAYGALALVTALPLVAWSEPASPYDELRELSEIDGDLATLTEEESRKMALLAQVLGLDPTAVPTITAIQPTPTLDAPAPSDT